MSDDSLFSSDESSESEQRGLAVKKRPLRMTICNCNTCLGKLIPSSTAHDHKNDRNRTIHTSDEVCKVGYGCLCCTGSTLNLMFVSAHNDASRTLLTLPTPADKCR